MYIINHTFNETHGTSGVDKNNKNSLKLYLYLKCEFQIYDQGKEFIHNM